MKINMSSVRKVFGVASIIGCVMMSTPAYAAVFTSSNESYNEAENRYTYEGNVRITIDGMVITCDRAIWNPDEKSLLAKGSISLRDTNIILRGTSLSTIEKSSNVSLSGDGYFHVMGLSVTAENITFDKKNGRVFFNDGVLISGSGSKKFYNAAIYDIAMQEFVDLVN